MLIILYQIISITIVLASITHLNQIYHYHHYLDNIFHIVDPLLKFISILDLTKYNNHEIS
jgi:hypothetical protein